MNNDLISRSALLNEYEWLKENTGVYNHAELEEHIQRIKKAPTVDAEPVRYGEFTELPLQDIFVTATPKCCESCKTEFILLFREPLPGVFCPRCGAKRKMDAEVEG